MDDLSHRDAFWQKIKSLAERDRNIVVISADMGAPALDEIRLKLPGQFINVGIAEQNAIALAAGLALTGKTVYAYAIAPFISLRSLEIFRVESGIMGIPIHLVGVSAGFGYADSGPTHHMLEDISIMRAMPNVEINSITDSVMASAFAEISAKSHTSHYIRLDREISPRLYQETTDFTKGMEVLQQGKDAYIIATGILVYKALTVAQILQESHQLDIGVIDLYTIPIKAQTLINTIGAIPKLITLEEHFVAGGLGSAVLEILNDNDCQRPVKRLGLPMEKAYCYEYGGREIIHEYYGIGESQVAVAIRKFLTA